MGAALSATWSECLGDLTRAADAARYDRVPARRVAPPPRERRALRQRASAGEKKLPAASQGAAIAAPAPPLVPDAMAVYDLVGDDEDVCSTCLESYSDDNPKITSSCHPKAAWHLQCIIEWQTRSGSSYCPICAKPMDYSEADQDTLS